MAVSTTYALTSVPIQRWNILQVTPYSIILKLETTQPLDTTIGRIHEFVLRWVRTNRAKEEVACHNRVNNCPNVVTMLQENIGHHTLQSHLPQLTEEQTQSLINDINKRAIEVNGKKALKEEGTWAEQNNSLEDLAIYMEAMHGDFEGFLKKVKEPLRRVIYERVLEICQPTFEEIHRKSVLHLDPCPRNIFYRFEYGTSSQETFIQDITIKVGDLGNAILYDTPPRHASEFNLLQRRLYEESQLQIRESKNSKGTSSNPHSPSKLNTSYHPIQKKRRIESDASLHPDV